MIDCNEFEQLLADAWGGELQDDQRPALEEHAASCASCQTKFAEGMRALAAMRSLESPQHVTARRDGDRLIIQLPGTPQTRVRRRPYTGVFRLAASILIAFTAGYALHAGLMMRDAALVDPTESERVVNTTPSDRTHMSPMPGERGQTALGSRSQSLRSSLASAYQHGHGGSDLARCLTALSGSGG